VKRCLAFEGGGVKRYDGEAGAEVGAEESGEAKRATDRLWVVEWLCRSG